MSSKFFTTSYLLFLISLGYVATDIYLPSLPGLAAYYQTSDAEVQLTLFSYLVSFSLGPLLFGPLSDHIGRRKVLLGGILVSIIATLGCLFSQTIYELIAARFMQGLGTGAVLISARATVADLFIGKELTKQMSFMTMLMPIVMAMAPTLGGLLQENFNWQAIFIFLICHMFVILGWISLRTETLKNPSQASISQIFESYRAHIKNPLLLAFGINFILPCFGFFAYLAASPFLFQEVIGLSPLEYGTLALYVGATIIVTGYINLKLIRYFELTHIIYIGAALLVFAGGSLLAFHFLDWVTTLSVLIPSLLYFTCMPLCVANAASKALSFVKADFGSATALLTTFQFLMGALGSFMFSFLPAESVLTLALAFIGVGLLSLINLAFACRLEAKHKIVKA